MGKGKTKYLIHTKEIYTKENIEKIITTQCEKKHYPVPGYTHGYLSGVAKSIGIEPQGIIGHSYSYHGKDVIPLIDKVLENMAKKKVKSAGTQTSPSTKPMAKPSQISIDDLSRKNNLKTIRDWLIEQLNIVNQELEE